MYHYYKCAAKLHKGSCKGGRPITIRRDELEEAVVETMASDLLTPQRVRETLARAVEREDSARETASSRLRQLKRQLLNAKRKEDNLWELAASLGIEAKEGFMSKLDSVREESSSLQRQIASNEKLIADSLRPLSEAEAAAKVSQMRKLLLGADVKQKRRFVHTLVEKVIVTEEAIEIIGTESTLAETASGLNITAPPVRGSGREWCWLQESNPRPPVYKTNARRPSRSDNTAKTAELYGFRSGGTGNCAWSSQGANQDTRRRIVRSAARWGRSLISVQPPNSAREQIGFVRTGTDQPNVAGPITRTPFCWGSG